VYVWERATGQVRAASGPVVPPGAPVSITENAYHPAFDPAGRHLVYDFGGTTATARTAARVVAWRVTDGARFVLSTNVGNWGAGQVQPPVTPAFSADGRRVVFRQAKGQELGVAGHDFGTASPLFWFGHSAHAPALSGDGLVTARRGNTDTGDFGQIVWERIGTGERRAITPPGADGRNGSGAAPVLSPDGRFVAFLSRGTNLVAADADAAADLFLHDTATGETIRLSGPGRGADLHRPVASLYGGADGGTLLFATSRGLAPDDLNAGADAYLLRFPDAGSGFRVTTITRAATGEVTLAWPAPAGRTYGVEFRADVAGAPGWQALGVTPQVADGTATAVDAGAAGQPRRFYRVAEQP
jgi:hypothetical protein